LTHLPRRPVDVDSAPIPKPANEEKHVLSSKGRGKRKSPTRLGWRLKASGTSNQRRRGICSLVHLVSEVKGACSPPTQPRERGGTMKRKYQADRPPDPAAVGCDRGMTSVGSQSLWNWMRIRQVVPVYRPDYKSAVERFLPRHIDAPVDAASEPDTPARKRQPVKFK